MDFFIELNEYVLLNELNEYVLFVILYILYFKFKFDKINEISNYLLDTYVYVKL